MPTAPPAAATRYYAFSALLAAQTAKEVTSLRGRIAQAASLLFQRQAATAALAEAATGLMLDAQPGVTPAADVALVPTAFTTAPVNFEAMAADLLNDAEFERLVASIMQDAARAAQQASIAARPHVQYVRHLNLPSCSRCAVLAGRVYRYSTGFQRHPGCFPAGTVVSGPGASRATRRWYEGELVIIRTAGGKNLTATANHPILTNEGWLPAHLLTEGSQVVSRSGSDRSSALVVPDHDQVPTRIEDVWSAGRVGSLGRVPVAPEDFHGDGFGSSHVDVVLTDGLVRDREKVALLEHLRKQALALRIELAVALNTARSGFQFGGGPLAVAGGPLGGLGLQGSLLGQHFGGAQQASLARMADLNLGLHQSPTDDHATDARALRNGVLTLPAEVGGNQFAGGDVETSPTRWDAPESPFSMEDRGGYASRGQDLFERLAGRVELDRVVELRRVSFAGHVFNLTSDEGWYDADGIIVSNCDCVMIPVTVASPDLTYDPVQLARDGKVTGLSKADLQAIDHGADFGKVVNVRLRKAGLTDSGRVLARAGRPTPEALMRDASSRDEALQLLTQFGYVR